jgi:hypothetical protein
MDGDGRPDLFVSKWDAPPGLYRNTRNGFVRAERVLMFPDTSATPAVEGAAWVDIDNDGDLDLHAVSRSAGRAFAFEGTGDGRFRRRDDGALRLSGESVSMVCWADVEGDGDLDAFIVGYRDSGNWFLRNDGDWRFTPVDAPLVARGAGTSRACGWGDLENDMLPDLFIGNAQGPNVFLTNEGGWQFSVTRNDHIDRHEAYTYGLSWADYDDDGDLDVFVANFDRENVLYENRGGHLVAMDGSGAIVTDVGASKGHTWGDFDLDGDLDLYVANGTPAPNMHNFLYANEGGGRFARLDGGAATADADTSAGAASADYDLDGDLDLAVGSWGSAGTRARLYQNQTAGRSWITLELIGVRSNRSGIGTHVSAYAQIRGRATVQHRWILATTGYASQNALVAHFGLGDADVVDSLLIRWPSGERDLHRDVGVNDEWSATEGGTLTGAG